MYKISWSLNAVNDLENIIQYLEVNWSQSVVLNFIEAVKKSIAYISIQPLAFPYINQSNKLRRIRIDKNNILIYKLNNKNIYIIHIFDARQQYKQLK